MQFLIQYDIPLYSISIATAALSLVIRERMQGPASSKNRLLMLAILFLGATLAACITMRLHTVDFSAVVTRSVIDEIAIVITWLLLPISHKKEEGK